MTFDYNITGIPVVDTIASVVLKLLAVIGFIFMVTRCLNTYRKGDYPGLFTAAGAGIVLLAFVFGFNNIAYIADQMSDQLPNNGNVPNNGGGDANL